MQRGQVREYRAGRRLKLSCRNWGQFGGGTEERVRPVGLPEERKEEDRGAAMATREALFRNCQKWKWEQS